MQATYSEILTRQFYQWEILGRGWLLAQQCIALEAPFTPFYGHFLWQEREPADDGIPPTPWNRLLALFQTKRSSRATPLPEISYTPFLFDEKEKVLVLQLRFAKDSVAKHHTLSTESFLMMLSYLRGPVSFELIATGDAVTIQVTCRRSDEHYLRGQVAMYFPGVQVVQSEDVLSLLSGAFYSSVDLGLEQEFTRPLNAVSSLDTYTGLFALFESLNDSDSLVYQVLFQGVINPWEKQVMRAVTDGQGKSFFSDAPEMPALAKQKTAKPLLAATVRVLGVSASEPGVCSLLQQATFALSHTFNRSINTLCPLTDEDYTMEERLEDVMGRTTRRSGMLLNTEELTLLVHLPGGPLHSKKLVSTGRKTKPAPPHLTGGELVLGMNVHLGVEAEVKLSTAQRFRHLHLIGATGTGKSTLLFQLIYQDILQGNGVAVLDPHGDLIEKILHHIPSARANDVVLIDPSDTEHPVAFNLLKAGSEIEKQILSSDLVAVFRRQATSWGDQMNAVLSNAVLGFLESTRGGTLLDLRRFLVEKSFREDFLSTIEDEEVLYFWQRQYPLLKTNSVGPILTRLDGFLRPKVIRRMVEQKAGLDFGALLHQQKIVLIKLSQGLIGEENAGLLGAFLVSKIQQAAMARQAVADRERNDFFFYIDEFHHFATPSVSTILSGARKYHLGLTLAHQNLQQLQKADAELAGSVLSNAGTRLCFRLGESDARVLEKGFASFDATDLQGLSVGEAIGKVERPGDDFSLRISPLDFPTTEHAARDEVVALSRRKYARRINATDMPIRKEDPQKGETNTEVTKNKMEGTVSACSLTVTEHFSNEGASSLVEEKIVQSEDGQTMQERTEHRYLQTLIKKMAEARGYRAFTEAVTPDGKGSVDVALEKEGLRIACEVSVTSTVEWEIHNIQKGFGAGYDLVIVCVREEKLKARFWEALVQVFDAMKRERIKVLLLAELFSFLEDKASSPETVQKLSKGYRVKVSYDTTSKSKGLNKKEVVTKVVAAALKKRKK